MSDENTGVDATTGTEDAQSTEEAPAGVPGQPQSFSDEAGVSVSPAGDGSEKDKEAFIAMRQKISSLERENQAIREAEKYYREAALQKPTVEEEVPDDEYWSAREVTERLKKQEEKLRGEFGQQLRAQIAPTLLESTKAKYSDFDEAIAAAREAIAVSPDPDAERAVLEGQKNPFYAAYIYGKIHLKEKENNQNQGVPKQPPTLSKARGTSAKPAVTDAWSLPDEKFDKLMAEVKSGKGKPEDLIHKYL